MAEMGVQASVRHGDAAVAAAPPAEPARIISDVWSRSAGKYRVRAIVLLVVDVLLFVGLGCFAYWLRTGFYFAPGLKNYWGVFWHTCQPGGETLTRLLTFPISWEAVPLQIVIHGLLLSALVSIPILVSILYRFPSSLPFVAIVMFVAMMPWLGLTLLGACVVASVRPFRLKFRFASAMLGLTLVVVYVLFVLRQAWPSPEFLNNPGDRVKLVAPWILAMVASCVLMALGLGLARLVNYRPGAIAPLLAMMFAIPVALFEAYVGRDELHYRLLEHDYGPASPHFRDREIAAPLGGEPDEDPRNAFTQRQQQAGLDCDWFLRHFPDSRYATAVLYLKGRALDMRVDPDALRTHNKLVFYDTYPSPNSTDAWQRLLANAPADSPLCAEALLRLALLTARQFKIPAAIELLERLVSDFQGRSPTTQTHSSAGLKGMLRKAPPESNLQLPLDRVVFEANRWLGVFRENRDVKYRYAPLHGPLPPGPFPRYGWLLFDPQSQHYRDNLGGLLERYPGCNLTDNVEVEMARLIEAPEPRIAALEACVAAHPQGDALPEALFWLGRAYLHADRAEEARRALKRVEDEFPNSIWRPRAAELLLPLRPAAPRESP